MMLALPSVTSTMAPLSALGTYQESQGGNDLDDQSVLAVLLSF
jgi:hypothetical protein